MIMRGITKAWQTTTRGFRLLRVELVADEPTTVHHFTIHGFSSYPAPNNPTLVFQPSGNADHLVALVGGYDPSGGAEGESVMWNEHGWAIWLKTERFYVKGPFGQRVNISNTTITLGSDADHPAVVRDGDATSMSDFHSWALEVTAACNAAVPASITVPTPSGSGTVTASSTKVFAE